MLDYKDIIRQDFEDYISDIQSYFRCLDSERARAFEEAREVSEDYGRFLQLGRGIDGQSREHQTCSPWKPDADNTLNYPLFQITDFIR